MMLLRTRVQVGLRQKVNFSTRLTGNPVTLAYEKFIGDDRPPLIILHGLLGNRNNWKSIAKSLHKTTNRTIYTMDARNHGESPHTPEMNYPLMGEDVVGMIEQLELSSAIVMGHSMGGRSAMAAALTRPELISQLMVLDISPFGVSSSISSLPRFVEMMRRLSLPPSLSLQEARTTVDRTLQSVVPEKEIRQFLLTNLYKDDSGDFKWKANLESISKNFNPHISAFPLSRCGERYDGPTSFIGGALSDYIKPHEHRDIKKVFPHATFQYLEGAGHWLHADKPKDFLQMVTPLVS